jgi:hypothetical protein
MCVRGGLLKSKGHSLKGELYQLGFAKAEKWPLESYKGKIHLICLRNGLMFNKARNERVMWSPGI